MSGAPADLRSASVWHLVPSSYQRHALHAENVAWVEKNCYIDLWIELLHAAKLEPTAMLPFVLASDFDGEQWTFYKPPHVDLLNLYGVSVQELNVFRPILEHALFHAAHGRLVLTEANAFWLPDTAATDYRRQHTKTTIAIESLDVAERRLRYFHNAGFYELSGEDFEQTFRLGFAPDPAFMPLFAEVASFERAEAAEPAELARRSRELLRSWLGRRPRENPMPRFAAHLAEQIPALRERGIAAYHAFAFATIRQCGSAFELGADYLSWLERIEPRGYAEAVQALQGISTNCKALILKGARAMMNQKPVDFSELLGEMASQWDAAMSAIDARA
jgi:hypothetical protein